MAFGRRRGGDELDDEYDFDGPEGDDLGEEEEEEEELAGGRGVDMTGAPPWIISGIVHLILLGIMAMMVLGGIFEPEPFLTTNFQPQRPEQITENVDPQNETEVQLESELPDVDHPIISHYQQETTEVSTKNEVVQQNKAKGEQDAISDIPLGGAGVNACIGLGGGASGAYGWRNGGGDHNALGHRGGSPGSVNAVELGLKWLADHQEGDGHWDCGRYGGQDNAYASAAVTGLALLAFLGAGNTESDGRYQANVAKALNWLQGQQQASGAFSDNNYAHNMCTLAVAEAFGMSKQRQDMAQRAVNYLGGQQKPGGGWDYGDKGEPGRNRNDTSITCWAVMALKSARISGLSVPDGAFDGAMRHFGNIGANSEFTGTLAYAIQDGEIQTGGNAILAMTMLSLQFLGSNRDDPFIIQAANQLREENPQLNNFYKLYYATLAMFNMGGADYWEPWNAGMRDPLIAQQVREPGDNLGSWAPTGRTYGGDGGRVYSTAMAVLCLEVYFRYLPVYDW